MKTKALLLGGLPVEQEGPWVTITDGGVWGYLSEIDWGGRLTIEVKANGSTVPYHCVIGMNEISGDKARALVTDDVSDLVHRVTVELQCLQTNRNA